jgi:hypothetical protein
VLCALIVVRLAAIARERLPTRERCWSNSFDTAPTALHAVRTGSFSSARLALLALKRAHQPQTFEGSFAPARGRQLLVPASAQTARTPPELLLLFTQLRQLTHYLKVPGRELVVLQLLVLLGLAARKSGSSPRGPAPRPTAGAMFSRPTFSR